MPNQIQNTKSKKYFVIKPFDIHLSFVIWILAFLFVWPASAQTDLSSGYTLRSPGNDLEISVAPNAINRSLYVDLQEASSWPAIPVDKVLISKVYYYAFLPAAENRLDSPLALTASYPQDEERFKEIFVFDEPTGTWRHLTGGIDTTINKLSAQTARASSFVAMMADKLDRGEYLKQDINSPSILVADAGSGAILLERGSNIKRPIASLTKLMTVAVFLDNNPGWSKKIAMQKSDDTIPAKIYVKVGDKISTRDLFFATLAPSANNAAKALARSTGLASRTFVAEMNKKAKALGMVNTRFVEPTGLSAGNVSTAEDYLKLAQDLLKNNLVRQATTIKKYQLTLTRGKKTIKLALTNSNKILDSPFTITGSKTGYTTEAGRCLMIRAKNKDNREVIVITLGATAPGKQWTDMNALLAAALTDSAGYKLANE